MTPATRTNLRRARLDRNATSSFPALQRSLAQQFREAFPDRLAKKTIVVVPSLTLDPMMLDRLPGQIYYEERLLCMLMLLRMPNTHVVYLTSVPVDPVIIDYYLHLLPGITGAHAMKRLTMLSCNDASSIPLTQKILERKRLIASIQKNIPSDHAAHLVCFNVTELERKLACLLRTPIYGCDPDLYWLGTKSGSRKLFHAAGVTCPAGRENIYSKEGIIKALCELRSENPSLRKAVIKVNDGFSGDGNAIFSFPRFVVGESLEQVIATSIERQLECVAANLSARKFLEKFELMGGIVEAFIDGEITSSPSVQCRINPLGEVEVISTHEQILGGRQQQVFTSAAFPANREYAVELAREGRKVAAELAAYGVLGRFGIDFLSVKEGGEWKHYALEINLRKGGTTHPYLMLQFLTDGHYDALNGQFLTANGQERFYFSSDNLESRSCKGLLPSDLIEIAIANDLLYDGTRQEGVMFHMISAMSQYGKVGVVCIGKSPEAAKALFTRTEQILEAEGAKICY